MDRWLRGLGLALLVVGCGGSRGMPRALSASIARDYPGCVGVPMRAVVLDPMHYEVLGCGIDVVYTCPRGARGRAAACGQVGPMGGGPAAAQPYVLVQGGTSGAETIPPPPPAYVGAAAPAPAAPVQPTAQVTVEAPPPTMDQIEAAVAQWLDQNRAAILGCTRTPAALVEVSWTAAGATSITLGGEMHGSPGEPCVVQALGSVRLHVGGQAGQTRHVVQ